MVTLDEDVVRLLRLEMRRRRRSFKEALNDTLRAGLSRAGAATPQPFTVRARAMGLRAGVDPAGLNTLADDLEVDAVRAGSRRPRGR
jgi:hypothetical protein